MGVWAAWVCGCGCVSSMMERASSSPIVPVRRSSCSRSPPLHSSITVHKESWVTSKTSRSLHTPIHPHPHPHPHPYPHTHTPTHACAEGVVGYFEDIEELHYMRVPHHFVQVVLAGRHPHIRGLMPLRPVSLYAVHLARDLRRAASVLILLYQ